MTLANRDATVSVELRNTFLHYQCFDTDSADFGVDRRPRSKSLCTYISNTSLPTISSPSSNVGIYPTKGFTCTGLYQIASMSTMVHDFDDLLSEPDSNYSTSFALHVSEDCLSGPLTEEFHDAMDYVSDSKSHFLSDSASSCEHVRRVRRRRRGKRGKGKSGKAVVEIVPDDEKTTVMLRNIPNKYTQSMVLSKVQEMSMDSPFDFFYLPIDFRSKCNVGYAFINFTSPIGAELFRQAFHGAHLDGFNSSKVCEVSFARVQGLTGNVEHYRNSPVCGLEEQKFKPLILDALTGEILPFPAPDQPLPPVKPRTACNRTFPETAEL